MPTTGNYTLSLTHLGTARLYLDGQLLIEDPGITLETRSVTMHLVAGQPHALRIEYAADRPEQHTPLPGEVSTSGMIGSKVRLGWQHPADAIPPAMQEAAALAALLQLKRAGSGAFGPSLRRRGSPYPMPL